MNERDRPNPFDDRLEWDRDGQYYHYLTKWMHALNRAGRVTGETGVPRWAIELAKTAHARFTYAPHPGGRKRMYWKMSIDLSRPLVPSMGHHDPLDGLITCCELQAASAANPNGRRSSILAAEIADLAAMCEGRRLGDRRSPELGRASVRRIPGRTVDPRRALSNKDALLEDLLSSSLSGLDAFAGKNPFALPARYRLAFREFGLSIGLKAVEN